MKCATMICITRINITMGTWLVGIKVGGSGLWWIRIVFFFNEAHHAFNNCFIPPIQQNMMKNTYKFAHMLFINSRVAYVGILINSIAFSFGSLNNSFATFEKNSQLG